MQRCPWTWQGCFSDSRKALTFQEPSAEFLSICLLIHTYVYILAMPHFMGDLSSPTRAQTFLPDTGSVELQSLNYWTTRDVPLTFDQDYEVCSPSVCTRGKGNAGLAVVFRAEPNFIWSFTCSTKPPDVSDSSFVHCRPQRRGFRGCTGRGRASLPPAVGIFFFLIITLSAYSCAGSSLLHRLFTSCGARASLVEHEL